ncbi:MAG: nicotinate-nicotinamide nucleotide adenylyltransferase [Anaeromyxobacter sp.]|nr:nicotinate-nicotinamide nucleotide adenylyltransferase [Anaeromyxobacter sp.]MBL0274763.1 nicotinate-nicotinamide nucleotide adenylyltransferase [Anaeromyxobacter sp.]
MPDRPEIALLGGSFNPPHVGHVMAAWWALATQGVREVWLLPAWRHPFGKPLAPFEDRLEMCRLAVVAIRGAHVCAAEADLADDPLCGKTARTLEHLTQRHPDRRFVLVVGADILPDTPRWYRWDLVQSLARVVVVGRQGYPGGAEPALPAVSSSEVRRRLAAGQDVSRLVPRQVAGYAQARGLYLPSA